MSSLFSLSLCMDVRFHQPGTPSGGHPRTYDHITTASSWESKCGRGVGRSWSEETDIPFAFNLTAQSHPCNRFGGEDDVLLSHKMA